LSQSRRRQKSRSRGCRAALLAADGPDLIVTAARLETALAELNEGDRLTQRIVGFQPGEERPAPVGGRMPGRAGWTGGFPVAANVTVVPESGP
jgi:hypothetical protein